MTFTFNNYATNELSKSPINDIVTNLLGGYEQGVRASYLQPALAEELQKAKLTNKWYEPNIKSEIGLRGAHAGLLGEQTRAAHATNEYLPARLKAQLESLQLRAAQDQMFNQMLKERLSGGGRNQPNMPMPNYTPGQGGAPFAGGEPSPFAQSTEPSSVQDAISQAFQQQPSMDDLFNKKFFGIDTFNPRNKAYLEMLTKPYLKQQEEELKLDSEEAKANFKESSAAQADLPKLKEALQHAIRMKDIIQSRPAFFGHWIAPSLFAKRSNDPLSGEFQALLVPQIAAIEKQLSERGNQLALKTSSQKLPGFDETQQSALGKMEAFINTLQGRIAATEQLAGGNIVRKGNKRLKFIDGHWYELKRGDY